MILIDVKPLYNQRISRMYNSFARAKRYLERTGNVERVLRIARLEGKIEALLHLRRFSPSWGTWRDPMPALIKLYRDRIKHIEKLPQDKRLTKQDPDFCSRCSKRVHYRNEEMYMVKNELWDTYCMSYVFLCMDCLLKTLEKALNRKLTISDFNLSIPVNYHIPYMDRFNK